MPRKNNETPLQSPCKDKIDAKMNEILISRKPESVPVLTIGEHSPFPVGSCPRAGWYAIEACQYSDLDGSPVALARGGRGSDDGPKQHRERITIPDLEQLVENFDPAINGGNGLLINDCHLHHLAEQSDKAKGFVRALAVARGILYGYLELTEQGHREVNGGEFWATSTEYPYAVYEQVDEDATTIFWAPRRLSGLALTNNPEHAGQPGLCRYHKQKQPMKKTRRLAALHTAAPDEDEQKLNTTTEEEQELHTEDDEEQELHTDDDEQALNTDAPADDWASFADEAASIFGLPTDMSGEEMLDYFRQIKADYDVLASAGSAPAGETATHCRPRFKGASTVRLNTGKKPVVNMAAKQEACTKHCQKAVTNAAAANGGRLDKKSFQQVWNQAQDEFNNKN